MTTLSKSVLGLPVSVLNFGIFFHRSLRHMRSKHWYSASFVPRPAQEKVSVWLRHLVCSDGSMPLTVVKPAGARPSDVTNVGMEYGSLPPSCSMFVLSGVFHSPSSR